jgi:hypothetical protein
LKVERLKLGTAVTVCSAATSLPFLPTAYADVSAWQQGLPNGYGQAYPYAEFELIGSTTIAATAMRLRGMVLDAVTVATDTFTTTHGSDLFTQTSHGFLTGDGPIRVTNSGGALPAGLTADTDYYVIKIDGDTFKVATTRALAFAGTVVNLTGDGTGTHTYATYTSGTTVFQRARWLNYGLLGELGDGAVALTEQGGYITRINHSPRVVAYALTGTLDTGNVTAKVRPGWLSE